MLASNPIYDSFLQTLSVAEVSIQRKCILPALILLYSTIDSAAFLATPSIDDRVDERFKAWVNRWMLRDNALPCTAEELYSARCGIIHSFSSDSRMTRNKGVRQVGYSWGPLDPTKLQAGMDHFRPGRMVAVSLEHLFKCLKLGLADFFEEATRDTELAARMRERARTYFSRITTADLDLYLRSINQ